MNSIEFIEELIENIETNISIGEAELKMYTDLGDDEEFDRVKNNLEYLRERLKCLNLIKNELEEYNEIKEYGISYENFKKKGDKDA